MNSKYLSMEATGLRTIHKVLATLLVLIIQTVHAQDSISKGSLKLSAYLEVYYCYDLANPANHERPAFFYNFNRHNEFNLNLGYIKANYEAERTRANLAFMAGTYAQYNLAGEPGLLKNVYEANVGIRILKKEKLWIDAGVMHSHLGVESAVGKDCWNLTRSIVAENSPYYETGIKLGYTSKNDQLYLAALVLNGWQKIQRVPGNQTPCFGTQLLYKPNPTWTLNWSTFIGNDLPDSLRQWRYYNDIYAVIHVSDKFGFIVGNDYGWQQIKKDTSAVNVWYAPFLMIRYKATSKLLIAARAEHYNDSKQVIISTGTTNGFQTSGFSLNLDYCLRDNVMWRIEGRVLNSLDKIFSLNNQLSNMNYFFTTSLAISF